MCDPGDDDKPQDDEDAPTSEAGDESADEVQESEASPEPETDPESGSETKTGAEPEPTEKSPAPAADEETSPEPAAAPRRLSSRDHQAEVRELDKLTKSLVSLPPSKLEALELDELTEIILAAKTKRKGALGRELRRISTKLRQRDPEAIQERLRLLEAPDRAEVEKHKACEDWRDRLLEGGDAVLSELVQAHPTADRQRLRQLVRTAKKDRTHAKSQNAFRELFREIRDLTAAAADDPLVEPAADS